MHFYCLTRGVKKDVDNLITQLQGKYLPFEYIDPNDPKKLKPTFLQFGVRPIQLWEMVFPEACKDAVLNTLIGTETDKKGNLVFKNTQHKKHKKYLETLRLLLGAEKIPKISGSVVMPIDKGAVEIAAIGLKKDYWQDATDEKRYDYKANENCFEGI